MLIFEESDVKTPQASQANSRKYNQNSITATFSIVQVWKMISVI